MIGKNVEFSAHYGQSKLGGLERYEDDLTGVVVDSISYKGDTYYAVAVKSGVIFIVSPFDIDLTDE